MISEAAANMSQFSGKSKKYINKIFSAQRFTENASQGWKNESIVEYFLFHP